MLLGLLSLPILWWLLRLVPPRPRRIDFPPTRLLFEIAPKEETPSRTPWWLTLLRLALAALVIIAAAGPLWNPPLASSQPRRAAAADDRRRLGRGRRPGTSVCAPPTKSSRAPTPTTAASRCCRCRKPARDISLQTAGAARVQIKQLKPKPHTVDRTEALPVLERFLAATPDVEVLWLSDGVDLGKGGEFVDGLKRIIGGHPLTVVDGGIARPHALAAADNAAGALTVKVLRAQTGGADAGMVDAIDLKGLPLGEAPFAVQCRRAARPRRRSTCRSRSATTWRGWRSPASARRARCSCSTSAGAGAPSASCPARPPTARSRCSAPTYYLQRALNPFADIRLAEGVAPAEAVKRFLDQHLPMLILADVGNVAEARDRLNKWIDNGGVLVRFAGPHLAGADDDDLVPVKLRRGGRILGGSLSWDKPQQLAAFSRESPFAGMTVPNDVTVTRQVLAEPDARACRPHLGDARRRHAAGHRAAPRQGRAGAVPRHRRHPLVRPAAVRRLRRHAQAASSRSPIRPRPPKARHRQPRSGASRANQRCRRRACSTASAHSARRRRPRVRCPPISPAAPTPIIRPASTDRRKAWSRSTRWRRADRPAPLDFAPLNARLDVYRHGEPLDLRGPVFLAALALLVLDALVVILLSGGIAGLLPRRRAAAALLAAGLLGALTHVAHPAQAQRRSRRN